MMAGVLSLLDAVPVLAAKGLVAVALLSRTTYKFLLYAVKSRIVHQACLFTPGCAVHCYYVSATLSRIPMPTGLILTVVGLKGRV